jgi:hypothetical protein
MTCSRNDELGAIIGCCRMLSMQAESLLSTNPVLLRMPRTERAVSWTGPSTESLSTAHSESSL